MELLVLLALIVFGLSVLIRRSRRAGASPAPAIQKISDPAVAHRALVENADNFANRPLPPFLVALANSRGGQLGESMLSVRYGPHWRALRCNLTAETLHPSRLGDNRPLQQEAIQALVAGLAAAAGEGAIIIGGHLDAAVFRVVARLCFGDGVDEGHVRAMRRAIRGTQQVAAGGNTAVPGSMLARLEEWSRHRRQFAFHGQMSDLVITAMAARQQERRGRRPCDGRRPYVDSLIDLRVPDTDAGRRALRDDEMVNLVMEFLGGGTGPVVACLEWTLAHLVSQPGVQEKLRREVDAEADAVSPNRGQLIRGMPYLHAVVLESLRMHPPVPFAMRHVQGADASRVLVRGTTAPAASDMVAQFVLGDIGRHSEMWKDPDVFRPERFMAGGEAEGIGPLPGRQEIRMMPFGTGHRFCPGVGLGMMNVKCFLIALVREFEWAPPTDAVVDLTELDGFLKTMKKPLAARLTRRT